jgi:hypothetical protein
MEKLYENFGSMEHRFENGFPLICIGDTVKVGRMAGTPEKKAE